MTLGPLTYGDTPIVAVVFDDDGSVFDYCYGWEAGENYALGEGKRVVAIADDGSMSVVQAQALYDTSRNDYRDCYGIED